MTFSTAPYYNTPMPAVPPPLSDPAEVRRFTRRKDAEESAYVLTALGISNRLEEGLVPGTWSLLTEAAHTPRARTELDEYFLERPERPRFTDRILPLYESLPWTLLVILVLSISYLLTSAPATRQVFLSSASSHAGAVRSGEIWRCVTALFLHADVFHLSANAVMFAYFGTLLGRYIGPGLTWAALLYAGVLGNLCNALFLLPGHRSIGSSTGAFAAIGIMAVYLFRRRVIRRLTDWHVILSGLFILGSFGLYGKSEGVDVTAHLFGFTAGMLIGLGLAQWRTRRDLAGARRIQLLAGICAILLSALSWRAALRI